MKVNNKKEGISILQNHLNKDIVLEYIKKFNKEQHDGEEALKAIFDQYRQTSTPQETLIKVILLNHIYSAGLNDNPPLEENSNKKRKVDVYTMANQLADISDKLNTLFYNNSKPSEAVEKIISLFENYDRPYSFATKYCHWHNPNKYPICDSFSRGVLYYFYNGKYKQKEYFDYSRFCEIYSDFSQEQCVKGLSIKEIDEFLWEFGKEYSIQVE